MELKSYQRKVIENLQSYLEYVEKYQNLPKAFNQYWEDKIGAYNPLDGTGMEPYKNNVPNAAHICIKVPTAGGKTFIAVNALHTIFSAFNPHHPKVVIWLVPWSNLLQQTVNALSNPEHPYRQKLNALFNHRVQVYQKEDLLQGANFNPSVVKEQLSIVVMSYASLKTKINSDNQDANNEELVKKINKNDRKVYQENGQLESFVAHYKNDRHLLSNIDPTALINVFRYFNPVVVLDESHNAESDLSVDMLKNLNPSLILDLTATPKNNSNIVSFVPAIELKKENMVKLPVIVYNSYDKTEVINNALHLQRKLESLAKNQEANGGKYIRPIVLFQAEPKTKDDNTTFEKVKEQLLKLGIPEQQIKIKTASIDELKGINLMSKNCEVRYIITINALKEGWDCPFAYILASLAERSSNVEVEQILGRVLRQPYVQKHQHYQLNLSYVLTASVRFNETLQSIVKGLQESGFSEKDYRKIDTMPEEAKTIETEKAFQLVLFPEQNEPTKTEAADESEEIDLERISFNPNEEENTFSATEEENEVLKTIDAISKEQAEQMEFQIKQLEREPINENIEEMGDRVKRYKIVNSKKEAIKDVSIPQFFIQTKGSDLFGTSEVLLNRESLLKDFKLSTEDIKIDFEKISAELYKVDLEQITNEDYRPSFTKIEENSIKDDVIKYIFSQPKDKQIKDITHQIVNIIGNMYPIADQEIKKYISRVLDAMEDEQLRDVIARKESYKKIFKHKIGQLASNYAEVLFNDMLKSKRIYTKSQWVFSKEIVPKDISSNIANSLYEKEGSMNNFEEKVAMEIGTSENILFWHRNLDKGNGKGFFINGFKSNHYPDFIMKTKSGKIILIEAKGDYLDGSDSEAKCRLGTEWERQAGQDFVYMMIFENKPIKGAYTLEKAKELIKGM